MGIATNRCPTCGKPFIPAMKFCPFDSSVLEPFVIEEVTTQTEPPSSVPNGIHSESVEVEKSSGGQLNVARRGTFSNTFSSISIALAIVIVFGLIAALYDGCGADEPATNSLQDIPAEEAESPAAEATPAPATEESLVEFDESNAVIQRNDIGVEMVWIPSGSFMMGSPDSEVGRGRNEGPQRLVTIRQGFWMGRHEVTQGQYEAVMGTNPSAFETCGKDCPVEGVSWKDAKKFISKLNARNEGLVYSLPSEAEWEYAARAGTTTAFAFGDSLGSTQANFDGNYPSGGASKGPYLGRTTKVGSYRPNAWGLYDMHGNVWEWVEDIYNDGGYTGLPTDGSANTTRGDSSLRVLRGGSWNLEGADSRSSRRSSIHPTNTDYYDSFNGFRVVARDRRQ
jgi:formylglycine-generating enzyme required for sulfatase activity